MNNQCAQIPWLGDWGSNSPLGHVCGQAAFAPRFSTRSCCISSCKSWKAKLDEWRQITPLVIPLGVSRTQPRQCCWDTQEGHSRPKGKSGSTPPTFHRDKVIFLNRQRVKSHKSVTTQLLGGLSSPLLESGGSSVDAPCPELENYRVVEGRPGWWEATIALMGRKIETPGFKESNKGGDGSWSLQSTVLPPSSGRRQRGARLSAFSTSLKLTVAVRGPDLWNLLKCVFIIISVYVGRNSVLQGKESRDFSLYIYLSDYLCDTGIPCCTVCSVRARTSCELHQLVREGTWGVKRGPRP